MTNEIKKDYQKLSRETKKLGFNYTFVMNAKQMRLGTATICLGRLIDYETWIEHIRKQDCEAQAQDSYKRANRFIDDYRRWAQDSSNVDYWKEVVEHYDNGTLYEYYLDSAKKQKAQRLESVEADFEREGTPSEQLQRCQNRAEELLNCEPFQNFIKKYNVASIVENKSGDIYLRLYYQAVAA